MDIPARKGRMSGKMWTFADAFRTGAVDEEVVLRAFEDGGLRKLAAHLERIYQLRTHLAA